MALLGPKQSFVGSSLGPPKNLRWLTEALVAGMISGWLAPPYDFPPTRAPERQEFYSGLTNSLNDEHASVSSRYGNAALAQDFGLDSEDVRHVDPPVRALLHDGDAHHGAEKSPGVRFHE